jgi:pteridine reductase
MSKAALITGAAKRIGKDIALSLAEMGYDIALHYNQSQSEANKVAELIRQKGVKCELFQCELSDMKQVHALIPSVLKVFPQLYLLINSASIYEKINLLNSTEENYDRLMNINFKAPFMLCRDFAQFSKKAGNIINILDAKIYKNQTEFFLYLLSKRMLAGFTELLALELAPNIRVNGIAPGTILPPNITSNVKQPQDPSSEGKFSENLLNSIPLKKYGNTTYIIQSVLFLLNNEYVTGQILFADGGLHL